MRLPVGGMNVVHVVGGDDFEGKILGQPAQGRRDLALLGDAVVL